MKRARPRERTSADSASSAGQPTARGFRGGCLGRLPGFHAHEVTEFLRHVEGAKEELRGIADEVRARLPEPAVFDHALRSILGAILWRPDDVSEQQLAQRIKSVELAAHMADLRELIAMPRASAPAAGRATG